MDEDLTPRQRDQLARFAVRVRESPHNLVSRRARLELEDRHIPESVGLATTLPRDANRCLDVGSGGGFPGLVVAIVRPDLEVHLLDATSKKVTFLRATAADLDVGVTVHHGRAEDLATGPLEGHFDLVTARAVAPLRELITFTVPFLAPQGVFYALKGDRWAAELEDAADRLRRAGAMVLATPDDQEDAPSPGVVSPRVVMIGRMS